MKIYILALLKFNLQPKTLKIFMAGDFNHNFDDPNKVKKWAGLQVLKFVKMIKKK